MGLRVRVATAAAVATAGIADPASAALSANGGEPGPCGWLKDRFGLSWQIVPRRLNELVEGRDPERARRAMEAMLQMGKIDVAELETAAAGS